MKKEKELPEYKYINECFSYNGELVWKERPLHHFKNLHAMIVWNSRYSNKKSGSIKPNGYLKITIDNESYLGHRIIWKLLNNKDPNNQIDHIDGNRLNNNINNLREATQEENSHNVKKSILNTSGVKGVSWHKRSQKWQAQFMVKGEYIHVGSFENINEAESAIILCRKIHHGDYSNNG